MHSPWLRNLAALAAVLVAARVDAASHRAPPPDGWQVIGSFEGSFGTGFVRTLNNWLFENERDGDLYDDLGDLSVGLGVDIGSVDVDWDNDFERRVIVAHEELDPGSRVTAEDFSRYREISEVRSRVRLTWDYLPDLIGDLDVGVQVEGGYVLALARSQKLDEMSRAPGHLERGSTGEEFSRFLDEHAIRGSRNPLVWAAGYGGGIIDMAAGALGAEIADTERAVVFFEDYAEPAVLMPDLGLPLKAELFRPESTVTSIGDTATYTAFAGVSPFNAFVQKKGLRLSFRRYIRFLRETTVQKRTRGQVLVRVRRSFSEGNERVPLKYRPELRWFAFSAGYTFFEFRREHFDETVDDVTYRIDLNEPAGWEFFEWLVRESATVGPLEDSLVDPGIRGVRQVIATRQQGPVRDTSLRARLFSWLRFNRRRVASVHHIQTPELELSQAVRRRSREARRPFAARRAYRTDSTLTAQTDVVWKGKPREGLEDVEGPAVTVETTISSRTATAEDLDQLSEDLHRITGSERFNEAVVRTREILPDETSGLILRLSLSFGPEQLDRLISVSEESIWRTLAELLLGEKHSMVWATPEDRYPWMPTERTHGRPLGDGEHISRTYDRLRGYSDGPRGRGLGLRLDHLDSRTLFIKANGAARSFRKLQDDLGSCLECLADLFERASEAVLLQALLVDLAGGIDGGDVGFEVELFTDQLPRPLSFGNDRLYTFSHRRRAEVLDQVADLYDSTPRLRAGDLLLNLESAARADTTPECLRLRIFSDQTFYPDLELRVAVRRTRLGADAKQQAWRLALGPPKTLDPSPFQVARHSYDLVLPWPKPIYQDQAYTFLMRIVTEDGLPVTEEQEIRAELPEDWPDRAPTWCPSAPRPRAGSN